MIQQTPPNTPDEEGRDPYGQSPSFAQDAGTDRNPYYGGGHRAAAGPDLDAGSPVLTATEARRLNRKALLFLGGIVVLLMLLGYFVLWGGKEDEPETSNAQTAPEVAIPDAPTAPVPDVQQPVELVQTPPPAELPELPPDQDPQGGSGRSWGGNGGPHPPSLLERRMMAAGGSPDAQGGSQEPVGMPVQPQQTANPMGGYAGGGVAAPTVATADSSAQFMSNPNALLVRGTYLRCVLETRIVTDIPGFTSCILTEPAYSVNGRQLLLPKGSKILGQYAEQGDGIARVAVVWDRIITPTGIDVTMSSPGVDGLGGAGHPGDYDGHWGSKIMSAMLISLISDAFQWGAAEYGPQTSTTYLGPSGATVIEQPFESATARSIERLANQALQKSAARPGTVTINQGTVVNVYVAQDVDFSSVLAAR